jgi:hypothetical protein
LGGVTVVVVVGDVVVVDVGTVVVVVVVGDVVVVDVGTVDVVDVVVDVGEVAVAGATAMSRPTVIVTLINPRGNARRGQERDDVITASMYRV